MRPRTIAFALLAVLLASLVPIAIDDADARAVINTPDGSYRFDNDDGGTLTFSVTNNAGAFTMNVVVTEGSDTVGSLNGVSVSGGTAIEPATTDVSVPMKDFKHVGTHTVVVTCSPADRFDDNTYSFTATIVVEKTLLSNWVTYLVIAIVVIVVVAFIYLRMRDQPKKKPEMTFEQLEEERKAQMASKGDRKKTKEEKAPSTERKRYGAAKSSSKAEEPKAEKKPSFEDLEDERKAKASKKKEEKSSSKTERQRYLESKKKKEE